MESAIYILDPSSYLDLGWRNLHPRSSNLHPGSRYPDLRSSNLHPRSLIQSSTSWIQASAFWIQKCVCWIQISASWIHACGSCIGFNILPNRRGSRLPVPKLESLETFREFPDFWKLDYFLIVVTSFLVYYRQKSQSKVLLTRFSYHAAHNAKSTSIHDE